MIKKLLKGLARVTPDFIHRVDDYLITRRPLIWSTRLHYVLFFSLFSLPGFALIVLALPVTPSSAYIPIYVSYLSIIVGLIALGLWFYSQSQYNIRKSYGKVGGFFQLRYTLIFVSIVFTLIITTFLPSWLASQRAYNFFLGTSAIKLVNNIGEQSYYDRYATKMDFFSGFPSIYEIEVSIKRMSESAVPKTPEESKPKERLTRESKKIFLENVAPVKELQMTNDQSRDFRRSGSAYLYILHSSYLTLPEDRQADLNNLKNTQPPLKFRKKTFERYLSDNSYYGQSIYIDEHGNAYSSENLVDLFFVERLLGKLFGSKYGNLQSILDGDITLSSSQEERLIVALDSIIEPPLIYSIVSDMEYERFGYSLVLMFLSTIILITLVATTTANYFGTKTFFIDTTTTVGAAIFLFVVTAILDEMTGINNDELLLLISVVVFLFALFINALLFNCSRRRMGAGFLWQFTTVSIPISLFFALAFFLFEILDVDFGDYTIFYIVYSFILFSLIVYIPFQLRLMYKLYSLPR